MENMQEIHLTEEHNLMEHIITRKDGVQIRMLLDAESWSYIHELVLDIAQLKKYEEICDYGSKLVRCIGA